MRCGARRWPGARRFKLYRQLKMYNDPALNPAIYGKTTGRNGDRRSAVSHAAATPFDAGGVMRIKMA